MHDLKIVQNTPTIFLPRKSGATSVTDCDGRGHIKHYTFETYMQQVLKANADNKKVQNPNGFVLPCSLTDGGCESTSLDPFAYTWTQPSNCLLSILFQNKAKMVKYLLDPTPAQYYIVSDGNTEPTEREKMYGRDENSDKLAMKFRIYDNKQELCGKKGALYRTNFDSLFISYSGGFDMSTGKPNVIHQGKNNYKMTVDSNNVVSINGMSKVSSNLGKFEKDKLHWNFLGTDKIDYELHLGAKLSYICISMQNS